MSAGFVERVGGNLRNEHLTLLYDSAFFKAALAVEAIAGNLPEFMISQVEEFEYRNPGELVHLRGDREIGKVLVAQLTLPDFSQGMIKPTIFVFSTPENNAMTIGRMYKPGNEEAGKLKFQLARFHMGPPAQYDLRIAMHQAAQYKPIQSIFRGLSEEGTYIVNLTREGHLTDWQNAIFESCGLVIPVTQAHVEHFEDKRSNNPFARVAKVCSINFEGMSEASIHTLVISDNTASGMQQVGVLEEIFHRVRERGDKNNSIRKVVVVSPLLTAYGAFIISHYLSQEGIEVVFVCSGTILGCNAPDRYYSPVVNDQRLCPDTQLAEINYLAHGPKVQGRACARGNWTASFTNPSYAWQASQEELGGYGFSNEELLECSRRIEMDDASTLIPYSTLMPQRSTGVIH